jgi:hypothetical protein
VRLAIHRDHKRVVVVVAALLANRHCFPLNHNQPNKRKVCNRNTVAIGMYT